MYKVDQPIAANPFASVFVHLLVRIFKAKETEKVYIEGLMKKCKSLKQNSTYIVK